MSQLEVDKVIPQSGTTLTLGESGDTITIPSGATTTLTDGIAGDLKFNSGFGSIATAYGCRAWVNFNGTGTPAIRESGNVTSITDNGTGDYTVNFTTAMPDANYCVTFGGTKSNATARGGCLTTLDVTQGGVGNAPTTTELRVRSFEASSSVGNSENTDIAFFNVGQFGLTSRTVNTIVTRSANPSGTLIDVNRFDVVIFR